MQSVRKKWSYLLEYYSTNCHEILDTYYRAEFLTDAEELIRIPSVHEHSSAVRAWELDLQDFVRSITDDDETPVSPLPDD